MLLKGRTKIVSSRKVEDMSNIAMVIDVFNTAVLQHLTNKSEIDWLMEYKNGNQPILNKTKVVRDDINNKLVVNHAQMITRTIIGYFLGTPIQYIQSGADKKTQIDMLNKYVAYEDKASVDKEIGEYQSITGTAYRIIYTDGALADEVPFEQKALDPSSTFVVYENTVAEKPLFGVTYHTLLDAKGTTIGYKIYIYTDFGVYEFSSGTTLFLTAGDLVSFTGYDIGGVPIIEYPNNMWRIGDWELCIGLMDAINSLNSGRLDDIDQIVQSLLIFMNADIDSTSYDEMREKGIVVLKNLSGLAGTSSDVKSITNELDQSGMNLFSTEMESLLYSLIGIPDRKNRAGGGADTGTAVELRDGWADLETVARNKELTFKRSEKQSLRIILKILNNKMSFDLSLLDVDIKFSRNKTNNLLVKTQSYQTLLGTKTLSPEDCLTIVDLVSDVNEYISRGKKFWGDSFAGLVKEENATEMTSVALETAKNPTESTAVVAKPKSTGGAE